MLPTQTPLRARTWAAEPGCCSARGLGWRCPPRQLAPPHAPRAGPDSAPSAAPGPTSSTTTTTTAEPPAAAAAAAAGAPSKDAILARIARAKKYKEPSPSSATGAAAESPPVNDAAPPPPPEAAPPGGVTRVAGLPSIGPTKVDWGAMVGFLDSPVSTERSGGGAPTSYGGTAPIPLAVDEAAAAAAAAERERRFLEEPERKDYMDMLLNSTRADGAGSATRAADALAAVLAESSYDSQYDGPDAALNPDQRMEEFTAAKEARLRALGGEVITADRSYNPGDNIAVRVSMGAGAGQMAGPEAAATAEARRLEAEEAARRLAEAEAAAARAVEEARAAAAAAARAAAAAGQVEEGGAVAAAAAADGDDEAYKPKVSTWGVFPRPKDISEAYGGGRDIKPGQELETPQQRQEREAKYSAALKAFKARAGLEVDPADEERAGKLYDQGMELFTAGELQASYDIFEKVLAAVPVKTKYGGLATLQKAIVLDSVGQSDVAQKLYKSIAAHGVAQVARKAKQMLFGFEAMSFLKAEQFDYSVKKSDYDKYFRIPADRRTLYVATEEERRRDEEASRVAGWVAAAVILTPVLAVAALALQQH